MGLLHTLNWNNYPNELDLPKLRALFDNSSWIGLCSTRNTINQANPSSGLLKALYYLLSPNECFLKEARAMEISSHDETIIQTIMSSSSGTNDYTLQYHYSKYDKSNLIHSCSGFKGNNLCYHASAMIAVALLYLEPDCPFSIEFRKLESMVKEKGFQDDECLHQLVITHEELYFDMNHNTIPVTENLQLTKQKPVYH